MWHRVTSTVLARDGFGLGENLRRGGLVYRANAGGGGSYRASAHELKGGELSAESFFKAVVTAIEVEMVVIDCDEPVDAICVCHVVNGNVEFDAVTFVGQVMPTFSASAHIRGFYASGQYAALRQSVVNRVPAVYLLRANMLVSPLLLRNHST